MRGLGLSHITFVVRDLDRMTAIIEQVLGGREVYASGPDTHSLSPEKFFLVGGLWVAVMQGPALAERSYNHVAFKVTEEELEACQAAVERLGLDRRPPRSRIAGEGRSLYFHDDDNHLFELHTGTLDERLAAYGTRSTVHA